MLIPKKMYNLPDMIKPTSFIQKVLYLDGNPWRLPDRPYIFPVLNGMPHRMVLKAGRQVEKSTTLGAKLLSIAAQKKGFKLLYVSPTAEQTAVFSRSKIEDVLKASPAVSGYIFNFNKGNNVKEKAFHNGARMYFRSAYTSADGIRGVTSGLTCIDEIQDVLSEVIPVIEECSSHWENPNFIYAGTPKTNDGTLEAYWRRSSQNIWYIKCMHCGHWNFPGIKLIRPPDGMALGREGLWCEKCDKDIYSAYGVWVSERPGEKMTQGFHLPQIILPTRYIDWSQLFEKIREYPKPQLMNEVFGLSHDSGESPITRDEVLACCSENPLYASRLPELANNQLFMGIDWGTGGRSYTVVTIGTLLGNQYKLLYIKRFSGQEADVSFFLPFIANLARTWGVTGIGADWGFGHHINGLLAAQLNGRISVFPIVHGIQNKFLVWNGRRYVMDRTEGMAQLFMAIKQKRLIFPKRSLFEPYIPDFTCIFSEYNYKTRRLQYAHKEDRPDDAVHAINYGYVLALRAAGKIQVSIEESRLPA